MEALLLQLAPLIRNRHGNTYRGDAGEWVQ